MTANTPKPTPSTRRLAAHLFHLSVHHTPGQVFDLTQEDMAQAVGVSAHTIQRTLPLITDAVECISRGRYRIIDRARLKTLAGTLTKHHPRKAPPQNQPPPSLALVPSQPHEDTLHTITQRLNDLSSIASKLGQILMEIAALRATVATIAKPFTPLPPHSTRFDITYGAALLDHLLKSHIHPAPLQDIPLKDLSDYAKGRRKPPPHVRKQLEALFILSQAWDTPLNAPRSRHPYLPFHDLG